MIKCATGSDRCTGRARAALSHSRVRALIVRVTHALHHDQRNVESVIQACDQRVDESVIETVDDQRNVGTHDQRMVSHTMINRT
jgi:hypothetical protein